MLLAQAVHFGAGFAKGALEPGRGRAHALELVLVAPQFVLQLAQALGGFAHGRVLLAVCADVLLRLVEALQLVAG
ncbi:hypothetical protein D9M69_708100 [compost metagenome]